MKAFRAAVWTVLAVLLAGGVHNIISPRTPPNIPAITRSVAAALGDTGFPTGSAEAFVLRFADVYLTYNSNDPAGTRSRELAVYAPPALTSQTGWSGSGSQQVLAGPFVATRPRPTSPHDATITVTAEVTGGRWVFLAVPVYADSAGGLVVSGPPGFVSPPPQATAPGAPPAGPTDAVTAQNLQNTTLPGFFTAWAASDATSLQRYLTPTATPAASTGLGGVVSFVSIANVTVPVGGSTRTITADVVWNAGPAGQYTQSYRLTVSQIAGQWYVNDIHGGYVAPPGAG